MTKLVKVCSKLCGINYRTDVSGRDCTSFRIGGRLGIYVEPVDNDQVITAMRVAEELEYPIFVIGNGSNMLIPDEGVDAMFIHIGSNLSRCRFSGNTLWCEAGTLLSNVAKSCVKHGLMGVEWAAGIPGTVGGGVAMNAGAYGGEIKDVLRTVTVYRHGIVEKVAVSDDDMGYRRSVYAFPDAVILDVTIQLAADDGRAFQRMAEYNRLRREKQPINMPSAGSTFKRPEGYFAGALIEGAGLKGLRVGDACVSEKHAGFVVNCGNATYQDVVELIAIIRAEVNKKYGVTLETEVKIFS